jgi:hypothetical protein
MCCTGNPQKPSEVMAAIQAKQPNMKIVPKAPPSGVKAEHFSIPKEIKEQLILQQQIARIPQKRG